jgi:hypothetical protein
VKHTIRTAFGLEFLLEACLFPERKTKLMLSLYIIQHNAEKSMGGGVEVQLHEILSSALDGCQLNKANAIVVHNSAPRREEYGGRGGSTAPRNFKLGTRRMSAVSFTPSHCNPFKD